MSQFYMAGYDLRVPRHERAFKAAIHECATDATRTQNIAFGPWVLESEHSSIWIRDKLRQRIKESDANGVFNDKLLVVPLGEDPAVAMANYGTESQSYAKAYELFPASARAAAMRPVGRILGISFTQWGATRQQNSEIREAIWKSFPDCTTPLRALWFVRSNKSLQDVRDDLVGGVLSQQDLRGFGLFVAELKPVELATFDRVRHDSFWLWEHGVAAEHTLLETSTPRKRVAMPVPVSQPQAAGQTLDSI